jgi:hypothetical protein
MCDKGDAGDTLVEQYDIVEGDDAASGPSEKDVGAGANLEDEAPGLRFRSGGVVWNEKR